MGAESFKSTPISTVAGENGSRVITAGSELTGRQFQTLQVTTAGTITHCVGKRSGIDVDFLTDENYMWSTVPLGLLFAGKDCCITEITTDTAAIIAT